MKTKIKKVLICLSLCMFGGGMLCAEENARDGFSLKAGTDLPGKLDITVIGDEKTADIGFGFNAAAEYAYAVNKTFSFGGGIAGQFPHTVDDNGVEGKLSFIDGYGLMNALLPVQLENTSIYTSLQLGWTLPFADESFKDTVGKDAHIGGDLYWGAAAGVVLFDNYLLELNYKAHQGEIEIDDQIDEFEHRHFGIAAGYQF